MRQSVSLLRERGRFHEVRLSGVPQQAAGRVEGMFHSQDVEEGVTFSQGVPIKQVEGVLPSLAPHPPCLRVCTQSMQAYWGK